MAAVAAAALVLTAPSQALAARAHGTLTVDQPTGTAGVTDTIDVFLTLTLDADSEALTRGAGPGPFGGPNFTSGGMGTDELMWAGFDTSVGFTQVLALSVSISPTGFFIPPSGGAYSGAFFSPFPAGGAASLAPNTPLSFKFATFTPRDPLGVAPGTYTQGPFGVGFSVLGKDLGGATLRRFFPIANLCTGCTFSRDVLAPVGGVPEPGTWALLIGGFGLTGAALRRRRPVTAG